jgi:hypothetical protein
MRLKSLPNPAIKIKILHVGLVLVVLPCLIDIVCLWALYDLTGRTEKLAAEERHIMEVVRHANTVMVLYSTCTAKLINYMSAAEGPNRARMQKEAMEFVEKLRREFLLYADSTSNDEVLHKQVMQSREITERQITNLLVYSAENEKTSVFQAYAALGPGIRKLVKDAAKDSSEIIRIIDAQQLLLDQKSAEQQKSRWLIKQIVLLGIAANTIFAIAFALIFFRWMTSRLRVLVDNAQRLPKMLPLNQHVTGSDELSYLDTVLH